MQEDMAGPGPGQALTVTFLVAKARALQLLELSCAAGTICACLWAAKAAMAGHPDATRGGPRETD